jgi:hypothetical protein
MYIVYMYVLFNPIRMHGAGVLGKLHKLCRI